MLWHPHGQLSSFCEAEYDCSCSQEYSDPKRHLWPIAVKGQVSRIYKESFRIAPILSITPEGAGFACLVTRWNFIRHVWKTVTCSETFLLWICDRQYLIASRPFKCFQSIDTLVVHNCRDPSQHTLFLKADGTVVLGLCHASATPPLYRGRTLCRAANVLPASVTFRPKRMSWTGAVSKGFAINICAKCKCFSVLFRQVYSVCQWIPGVDELFHIISARVSNLFSSSNFRILPAMRNQRASSLAFRVHMSRNHDNYQCKDSEMLVAPAPKTLQTEVLRCPVPVVPSLRMHPDRYDG